MSKDSTLVEVHARFYKALMQVSESERVWSCSQVARLMGSNPNTATAHARVAEFYGACQVAPNSKGTGHLIIPRGIIRETGDKNVGKTSACSGQS